MPDQAKLLVTGATGFIGTACLRALEATAYEIHAIYRGTQPANNRVRWHKCDLSDYSSVANLVQAVRPSHLLHLAWQTNVPNHYWSTQNLVDLASSLHLFKAFIDAGGQRFVGAGTYVEFGDFDGYVKSSQPTAPQNLYAQCKDALCKIVLRHETQETVSAAWGRIFLAYGPGDYEIRMIPQVVAGLLANRNVPCSEGTQIRDFVYVDDIAKAFVELLQTDVTGAFNIGSFEGHSVREVATKIHDLIGTGRPLFGARPSNPYEPKLTVAARDDLIKHPATSLDIGLRRTVEWFKARQRDAAPSP